MSVPSIAEITERLAVAGYAGITQTWHGDQVIVHAAHRHFAPLSIFGMGRTAHAAYLRLAERVDDLMETAR